VASILFVCTGNICRSPTAEGFALELLSARHAEVEVSSAGIVGWEGSPAADEAVQAAGELGADISGHRARRLERSHVEAADLVVCMATEHTDAVARLVPDAEPRTFTLKELVRLLESLPPADSAGVEDRVRAAGAVRPPRRDLEPTDQDVADPLGMSIDAFRTVAGEIHEWSSRLVAGLFGGGVDAGRQAASA